ncbi:MAG: helicase, partial [Promethearchaeota archaeon CR_4]
YDYQGIELVMARNRLSEKAASGDARAQAELTKIKQRQRALDTLKKNNLAQLQREPELVTPGDVIFIAHALVIPTSDPEDLMRHDKEVEDFAMQIAITHEKQFGTVKDVSKPQMARDAGLLDYPGFDLLSQRSNDERAIEVKGRAIIGNIELTENEWAKACNLRSKYWLYVVFNCGTPQPKLHRVQDPFERLLAKARGGVIISDGEILKAEDNSDE